ncbi:unnamed protein product [Symbiodinium necroappetens]|uniref:Uncharacterized protein n=1 Tax=Symbiodinium necroappetens TaxID=1628268 RepID=A0A813BM36_9DINO|nr:unnamed protein product [Symbiodinium necroappetens]
MQMHERQVARQRQQLEYSFAELSRNPHGMSEGEMLRSKALEQRERREQRERLRSGTPPRTAAPQAAPVVPGPGSGAAVPPGPTASFIPFGDRGLLPEAGDDVFASPEASRFHLDPSAVMTARNWSPGHSRPDVARFDLDPVTQRDWARPGTVVPDRNYTPSYMRPQLFSGPVQPGLMSQDSSPAHGTAPTLFDPTSPHAASSGQPSQPSGCLACTQRRARLAACGPLEGFCLGLLAGDPMSVMEQSRKVAEDALYQNEAGRKKAERERQKAAEEQAGAWDGGRQCAPEACRAMGVSSWPRFWAPTLGSGHENWGGGPHGLPLTKRLFRQLVSLAWSACRRLQQGMPGSERQRGCGSTLSSVPFLLPDSA